MRAIRLGWKDASIFVNRGAARWELGQLKAAKRDFRKALRIDPENPEATANLSRFESESHSLPLN
jgi:Flp pilus assembly protein TadD